MKLPSIQFYPGDWFKDLGVQSLTYEEKGIWFEMLMYMFQSEQCGRLVLNGQPMSDEDMANLLHLEVAKLKQTLKQLLSKGVASKDEFGAIINRRMVTDDKLRKIRAVSGSLGGKQTSSKRQANVKQKSTPSSSSSFSSSSSSSKKEVKKIEKEKVEIPQELKESEKEIRDWLAYKQERWEGYKPKGLEALWKKLLKMDVSRRRAAIEFSMANNYMGIFEPKEDKNKNGKQTQERPHLAPQGEKGLEFIKRAREQVAGN